jgi:hypothetical protein
VDLPLAECRLDNDGLREQRERYRRLAAALQRTERPPGELVAHFSAGIDEGLLEETLAVERRCCAFFRIDYDPAVRELRIGVEEPELEGALDGLHHALTDQSSRS